MTWPWDIRSARCWCRYEAWSIFLLNVPCPHSTSVNRHLKMLSLLERYGVGQLVLCNNIKQNTIVFPHGFQTVFKYHLDWLPSKADQLFFQDLAPRPWGAPLYYEIFLLALQILFLARHCGEFSSTHKRWSWTLSFTENFQKNYLKLRDSCWIKLFLSGMESLSIV